MEQKEEENPRGERRVMTVSDDQLRRIVRETSKEVTHEVLLSLGLDANNPLDMQRDFQRMREWSQSFDTIKKHGWTTILGLFLLGLAAIIVSGLKEFFK